jgi:hypothetical protein
MNESNNKQSNRLKSETMSSTKQMRFNCECCGYATDKKSSMTTHLKTKKHASNLTKQQLQTECVKEQHERELMGLEDANVFIPKPKVEEEDEFDLVNEIRKLQGDYKRQNELSDKFIEEELTLPHYSKEYKVRPDNEDGSPNCYFQEWFSKNEYVMSLINKDVSLYTNERHKCGAIHKEIEKLEKRLQQLQSVKYPVGKYLHFKRLNKPFTIIRYKNKGWSCGIEVYVVKATKTRVVARFRNSKGGWSQIIIKDPSEIILML